MQSVVISLSFVFFLCLFLAIGISSTFKKDNSIADYLLTKQSVPDWMAALSAVASNNSGYMFIGMIGYTYTSGLSSVWAMIGWIGGDFLISLLTHKQLLDQTSRSKSLSFSELLGTWGGVNYKKFRRLAGSLIVLFMGVYAAAQLHAGSKALHVIFGWHENVGAIIGASIVVVYCFSGGMRASIWTDIAQSVVMFFAMALLCGLSIKSIGGIDMFLLKLDRVSADYLTLFPTDLNFGILGAVLFGLGWFFAGIAVIGQPHIMSRFMALKPNSNIKKVRLYYYSWYIAFFCLTLVVGLCARILIPFKESFDSELALPLLSLEILPPVLIGLILAGVFSASMSTADSQILSCIACISRDIFSIKLTQLKLTKRITLCLTIVILLIAIFAPGNVFSLVLIAWSGLASAFAPLLILYVCKHRVSEKLAVTMALTGLSVVICWRLLGLNYYVVEVFPGMLSGFAIYYLKAVFIKY